MGRVLITLLGTGSADSNRTYRKTTYRFSDGCEYDTSFVADALVDHYDIDRIIMLGTAKSMWEEVYSTFCSKRGLAVDESYYWSLADTIDEVTISSSHLPFHRSL